MKRSKSTKNPETPPPPQRRVLVLHGPNLNLLGLHGTGTRGLTTLAGIHAAMDARGRADSVVVESFQSNHEGQLIDRVQAAAAEGVAFIIVNPAAYTHTSLALRDALVTVGIPFVEVHLENIHAREQTRHHSHFSDRAIGVISGLGPYGYLAALEFGLSYLREG